MKCNIFILYTNNSSHVKLYRDKEEFNTHTEDLKWNPLARF